MKILWNILLGLLTVLSAAVLILQGFGLPALSPALCVILRILTAVFGQWLFLRLFQKKLLRAIPTLAAAMAAVWGFFLYLSSPSWVGATLKSLFADYVSFLLGCCLVWVFAWLMPRILPRIKKLLKSKKRRKKKTNKNTK